MVHCKKLQTLHGYGAMVNLIVIKAHTFILKLVTRYLRL